MADQSEQWVGLDLGHDHVDPRQLALTRVPVVLSPEDKAQLDRIEKMVSAMLNWMKTHEWPRPPGAVDPVALAEALARAYPDMTLGKRP
jgi:hypothetical protein